MSHWKRQLLDGASELFTLANKSKDMEDAKSQEAKLFQQIGRLQMELEWLKKVSAALTHVNCANRSITTTRAQRQQAMLTDGASEVHALLPADTGA